MSHEEVNQNLDGMLAACTLLAEPSDLADLWRTDANRTKPTGKSVHDLRLVTLMGTHGVISILTLNTADFKRYVDIRAIEP